MAGAASSSTASASNEDETGGAAAAAAGAPDQVAVEEADKLTRGGHIGGGGGGRRGLHGSDHETMLLSAVDHVSDMRPDSSSSSSSRSRVLVAIDESEECVCALSWAIDNLISPPGRAKCRDVVVLLHVQNHPKVLVGPIGAGELSHRGFYITPEILETIRKSQDHASRRVLLRAKLLCDEKHLETETVVAVGDARDGICEAVEKLRPRYLVIGSHGYGALKRTFLGSVSDYCAYHAKCPLVIVKKQVVEEIKP